MKTSKKLYSFAAALLLATSAGSAFADEGVMTQSHTRTALNLQIPTSDFGQSQNREEHTVMNQNQNQYQHQYRYQNQNKESKSGGGSMNQQNMASNAWQSNNSASSMNRMNTTNRHMQGSAATGSMNRSSSASRSMGGGRR